MSRPRSVVWLTLGDRKVASSRVRAFEISDALARKGIRSQCVVASGLRGRLCALRRLIFCRKVNVIVVQKLLFGQLVLQMLRRRADVLVWECDDALNLGYPGSRPRELAKEQRLVEVALRHVDVVTTANPQLAKELRPRSGRVGLFLGPAPSQKTFANERKQIVVWLGSPSTEPYLSLMNDVPVRLREAGWECVAIGAGIEAASFGWRSVDWSLMAQRDWLSQAVVGVMPQPSDPWAERKQGYKLYEYMAYGVAPVASDVLPARMVMDNPRLRPLLVRGNADWMTAIMRAASLRVEILPDLAELLQRQSIESAASRWAATVGLAVAS